MGYIWFRWYVNYVGGRKYKKSIGDEEKKYELLRSEDYKGKKEKEVVVEVFREYWDMCKVYEGY